VYEGAAVLRFGRLHRVVGAGWHWKWPLIEKFEDHSTCLTTLRLPAQSLTTKDDVQIVIGLIVKYEIKDVGAYVSQIFDQKDVLADTTMGAVSELVLATEYSKLLETSIMPAVLTKVRRAVSKYGFDVSAVTLTDFGKLRTLRLIQQALKDLDN
jgi:regulator of protease activity HflC (stomatin/prohibitin superfamily)